MWRLGLAIFAAPMFLVGVGIAIFSFSIEVRPDSPEAVHLIGQLPDALYYGWPVLVVVPIAALVVRWRLPRIAFGPRDSSRTAEIVVLIAALPVLAVGVCIVLFTATSIVEGLLVCETVGC